jgi:4-amino-4-deoxy-L-arabinose transferase-like glycosyltransferase
VARVTTASSPRVSSEAEREPRATSERVRSTRRVSTIVSPGVLACAAIVGFYVVLRLLLVWRFPPFLDEALYSLWAIQAFEDRQYLFISLAEGKEPLLTWLGLGWMSLGVEPLTALRLVSVASGLVTMVMVGLIARRFWGDRVALAAAAMYAVIPFFVVHDAIGIMEPLVTAAAMSALYLQIRLAERPSIYAALLLGLAFAAGLLTKETMKFTLALLPLSLLCFNWSSPGLRRRIAGWLGGSALALAIAGLGYSLMRLSNYWDDFGAAREEIGMYRPLSEALSHPWRYYEDNWPLFREALGGYLTVPIVLLFVLGAAIALRARPRAGALLLGWALAPLAAAVLLANFAYPRYLVIAIPPTTILAALGLVRVAERIARRRGALVATAAALLLAVPALVFDARVAADPAGFRYPALDDEQFATGWAAGRAWEEVAAELQRRVGRRPALVQLDRRGSAALELLLRDRENIKLAVGSGMLASTAPYAIENGLWLERPTGLLDLRPVWETQRPRDGTPVTLFVRGPVWKGRFHATPERLRTRLGGTDATFTAFLDSHPEVRAWYRAWLGSWEAEED